jgi:succinyl-CoA synthetase beta subunit
LNIHEYQAKTLFREYGIPTPEGIEAFTVEEARVAVDALGDVPLVVKAQIHAGGRGKAGGVLAVLGASQAKEAASSLLGKTLYTKQTGPQGKLIRKLLIEKQVSIAKEYYLSMVIDSKVGCVSLVTSSEGGMEIEEVTANNPEKVFICAIDPFLGVKEHQILQAANRMEIPKEQIKAFSAIVKGVYRLFTQKNCSMVEINPLTLTGDGQLLALDAKINLDESGFSRHPELPALRDRGEEEPLEAMASDYDMNYVSLSGNIGCMVVGAGMGMTTMDTVKYYGGLPANFMDCGGSVGVKKAKAAFEILMREKGIEGIFVNIFGGITRTNLIAEGILQAVDETKPTVPIVVRLEGTGSEEANALFRDSRFPVHLVGSLSEGAQKIISLTKKERAAV